MICCNQNCAFKRYILAPSYDVLLYLYQFSDVSIFKTTIRNELWLATPSRVNSRLSANSSNISVGWLGDRYKEIKLHSLFAINTWRTIYSWRNLISNICKAFYNTYRHHPSRVRGAVRSHNIIPFNL